MQLTDESIVELINWVTDTNDIHIETNGFNDVVRGLSIETLEGRMFASMGDWIIRGVNGEHYPCKPDIFEKTYDAVN